MTESTVPGSDEFPACYLGEEVEILLGTPHPVSGYSARGTFEKLEPYMHYFYLVLAQSSGSKVHVNLDSIVAIEKSNQ